MAVVGVALVAQLASTPAARSATDVTPADDDATVQLAEIAATRVVVRWTDGTDGRARRDAVATAAADAGLSADDAALHGDGRRTGVVDLAAGGAAVTDRFATALDAQPGVQVAEPDRVVTLAASPPSDELFGDQWGLDNTGQTVGVPGSEFTATPDVDIRLLDAWDTTRGNREVRVAVIDTAIDSSHPDLLGAVVDEVSTVEDGDEPGAHGTAVAGVIGARADDGVGMAGVAPAVSLLSIASFTDLGDAPGATTMSAIIDGIDAAVDAGADVINASWETPDPSEALYAAIEDAGVPFVAAAGNGNPSGRELQPDDATYPAGFDLPNILAVTAVDPTGEVPLFANVGGEVVDIAAPGDAIVAPGLDGGHVWAQGTSFAAPHAAGALALAHTVAPYVSTAELVDAAIRTTTHRFELDGLVGSAGLLDAAALVEGVAQPVCRPDQLPEPGYDDVAADHVHAPGIACLTVLDVASGTGDGLYRPAATITREQAASLLAEVLSRAGVDVSDAPSAGYVDVPDDGVHTTSIDALAALEIVTVGEDRTFRPREALTRSQLASLLVRTHDVVLDDPQPPTRPWFTDTGDSVHRDRIDRARDLGVLRGVDRVRFDPTADVRRDQVASLVARLLDALGREGVVTGVVTQ